MLVGSLALASAPASHSDERWVVWAMTFVFAITALEGLTILTRTSLNYEGQAHGNVQMYAKDFRSQFARWLS